MKVCLLDPRLILPEEQVEDAANARAHLLASAKAAERPHFQLIEDPAAADLILLDAGAMEFGPFHERLRRHPLIRRFRSKFLVYSKNDNALPVLRGLYSAIDAKWVEAGRALPVMFIDRHIPRHAFRDDELQRKGIACSFMGSSHTHPIRKEILRQCTGENFHLVDSCPDRNTGWWWEKSNAADLGKTYRDILARSQFVLCPRGISPATMRLFEAMEAAAAPIIIADNLQLPTGPDWHAFALFVPESEISSIPDLVRQHLPETKERGRHARATWQKYFSEGARFNYLIDRAAELLRRPHSAGLEVRLEEHLHPANLRQKITALRRRFTRP